MPFCFYKKLFLQIIFVTVILIHSSYAGISLIRDAQTEEFLYKISNPIFRAANLDGQITMYIINDESINAFVAGGKNIFMNSGTISFADDPLGLIGIIAHEIGHITGSHLARMSVDIGSIKKQLALGYILGIATAIAGSPDAGQAVILGTSHVGERTFFSHSIRHEESADEAALKFLDNAQISSTGLLEFFKEIRSAEKIYFDTINPYTRTHPLTKNRIERIATHASNSIYKDYQVSDEILEEYNIIKGKLIGFLQEPEKVLDNYDDSNNMGIIAIAVAQHRLGRSNDAIKTLSKLNDLANTPYMLELKGQIYYESGESQKAFNIFSELITSLPDQPLIKIEYAAVILSLNNDNYFPLAIKELNSALLKEKDNFQAWKTLVELYSKTQNQGMMNLSLAEANLLSEEYGLAIRHAKKAKEILKDNSKAMVRASDIIEYAIKKL